MPEIRHGGYFGSLEAEPPAARGQWGFGGEASSRRRLGVWGRGPQPSEAGGMEAEPSALENFAFFLQKLFNFRGAILMKNNAFKTWHRNWQCNMIQLVALMGYVGGG